MLPFRLASAAVSSVPSPKPMAAKVTVIGAAITYGGQYNVAVTTRVHAGSSVTVWV